MAQNVYLSLINREGQREKGLLITIRGTKQGDLAIRRTQSVPLTTIRSTQPGKLRIRRTNPAIKRTQSGVLTIRTT